MAETLVTAAALGAVVWATARRAAAREARAEADFPPTGQILQIAGRAVHVHQEGQGPDLVLIHGASGNTREFTMGLVARLAPQFRVTVFDRPGLGWSADLGAEGVDPAAQARHLRAAAVQLGLRNPLILGHSYGGAVALAWALQEDVAGLLLLSGVAMPWQGGLGAWYRITAHPLGRTLIVPMVTAFATRRQTETTIASIFAPQDIQPGYIARAGVALTLRRKVLAANARQVNGLLHFVRQMAPDYPRLTLPVEIVHGDSDTIVPHHIHAVPLAQVLPAAQLTLLPGTGHMPHQTRPEAVIDAVHRLAARAGLRLD